MLNEHLKKLLVCAAHKAWVRLSLMMYILCYPLLCPICHLYLFIIFLNACMNELLKWNRCIELRYVEFLLLIWFGFFSCLVYVLDDWICIPQEQIILIPVTHWVVTTKIQCWSPNLSYHRIGPHLEIGSLQI